MRKIITTIILSASLLASVSAFAAEPQPATEGKFAPAVVAVVDMQKIMQESLAAKSVKDQLAAQRQTYQKEVTADEQKLRENEKSLQEQRAKLSAEDFAKKRTDFETQVRAVQEKVQQRAQALDVAFNQAFATIKQSLGKIVAQEASNRGANVVLDRGQTVVIEASFDITAPVLAQLNKDLPKVAVTIPALSKLSKPTK